MRTGTDRKGRAQSRPIHPKDMNVRAGTRSNVFPVQRQKQAPESVALSLLGVLAVAYSLYFAADILLPIALAIYLNLLLSPVVRGLRRTRIPPAASALVLVGLLVWSVTIVVSAITEPAQQWITEAPNRLHELRANFADVQQPLEDIQEFSAEVKDIATLDQAEEEIVQRVSIEEPGLISQFLDRLPTSVTSIGVVIFLTFFLLASNGSFSRKCTRMGRSFAERRRIVMIFHDIQHSVSRYLVIITCINTVLGLIVTGTMFFLDFEDPWLWGIVAGLLNFIPYVGPLATTLILVFVGITSFPDSFKALISPLLYLGLTIVEGQIITPMIVGQRLELSPVIVFLFLVFWGWIWGPIGMLLAIPILVSIKIMLENTPGLAALAPLLSK